MTMLFKPRQRKLMRSHYGLVRATIYEQRKAFFIKVEKKNKRKWDSLVDYPLLLDTDVQKASCDCLKRFAKQLSGA